MKIVLTDIPLPVIRLSDVDEPVSPYPPSHDFDISVLFQPPSPGGSDGVITVTTHPINEAIVFNLNGVVNSTGIFSGLAAGNYVLLVTWGDNTKCKNVVLEDGGFVVSSVITRPSNDISTDGQIQLTATPAGSYTYTVTGVGSNSTGLFTDLVADAYEYSVTDGVTTVTGSVELDSNILYRKRLIADDYAQSQPQIPNDYFDEFYRPVIYQILDPTYVDSETTGYYWNEFVINQNKTTSEWLIVMFHCANLTAQTWFKTGAILRHNVGGVVYNQNNSPTHTYNGNTIHIVSSTDGLSLLTRMYAMNHIRYYYLPYWNIASYLITGGGQIGDISLLGGKIGNGGQINLTQSLLSGDITSLELSLTTQQFTCTGLLITGIAPACKNGVVISGYTVTGGVSNYNTNNAIYHPGLPYFGLLGAANSGMMIPGSTFNTILGQLVTQRTATPPTANLLVQFQGGANGALPQGASNANLIALQAIYAAAGRTLTCTYNTI